MYNHFFNLKQSPFSIAPDPRYLFMSERHREALAHLLYGVGSGGGFVLLTGEIGAGKTTVCRCFIEQIPANCRLAYIFNPKLSVEELLLTICDEFRIAVAVPGGGPLSVKTYVDAINLHLLASHAGGKNNVLIVDEAQNLSTDVLEQLRLLTNLETNERKLLQVILIGQPELREILARPELEQLAQRVIARYHLGPLSEEETGTYIGHRLAVAGAIAAVPFPRGLVPRIHQLTQGVPRRINLLCDRAMLGAYVENSPVVTRTILRRAAEEVFAGQPGLAPPKQRWPLLAAAVMAGVAVSAAAAWRLMPAKEVARSGPPRSATASGTITVRAPSAPAAMPVAYSDEQLALRELAALWGRPLPQGDACQVGQRMHLRCYQGRGGLFELRQLNRPAILTLRDGANTGYVLMTAMDDTTVTLSVNGVAHRVPVSILTARFDGAYTTFWSMQRFFRDQIAAGERGADVDWIGARLAQINKTAAPVAGRPLDAATQSMLRAFQAANNLKADGVVGPRTFMRLNQLTGVAEPRLLAAANTGK